MAVLETKQKHKFSSNQAKKLTKCCSIFTWRGNIASKLWFALKRCVKSWKHFFPYPDLTYLFLHKLAYFYSFLLLSYMSYVFASIFKFAFRLKLSKIQLSNLLYVLIWVTHSGFATEFHPCQYCHANSNVHHCWIFRKLLPKVSWLWTNYKKESSHLSYKTLRIKLFSYKHKLFLNKWISSMVR